MTTAVVLFATAGGIIPPSPSEQEIWDSFDPPEITDSVAICGCTGSGRSRC
jgi:hypothetical protein